MDYDRALPEAEADSLLSSSQSLLNSPLLLS